MPTLDDRSHGQRVVDALVPRFWKDMNALHIDSRIAYSTVHAWKSGKADPQLKQIDTICALVSERHGVHITAADLLSGQPIGAPTGALRDHPDWPAAEARARIRYRRRIPESAWLLAAGTRPAKWPEHVDETFVYDLADFWHRHGSDDALARAEAADIEAEIAAEEKRARGAK